MGNMVTPCLRVPDPISQYGLFGWTIFNMCDRWAASHLTTPFVLALLLVYPTIPLFGKWFGPFLSFMIAGIFEMFEIFSRVFFGAFITFFTLDGLSAEPENFVGSYLEDWGLHGGLGAFLLAGLYINAVKYPPLLWGARSKHWRYTLYYIAVIILYVLPFTIFSIDLDNGFPLGPIVVASWQVVWTALVVLSEGYWMGVYSYDKGIWISGRWRGYTRRQRLIFWWGIPAITAPYLTQNIFDWLYSNAIQSYVMVTFYSIILLLVAAFQRPPTIH